MLIDDDRSKLLAEAAQILMRGKDSPTEDDAVWIADMEKMGMLELEGEVKRMRESVADIAADDAPAEEQLETEVKVATEELPKDTPVEEVEEDEDVEDEKPVAFDDLLTMRGENKTFEGKRFLRICKDGHTKTHFKCVMKDGGTVISMHVPKENFREKQATE